MGKKRIRSVEDTDEAGEALMTTSSTMETSVFDGKHEEEVIVPANSTSVAGLPLPPLPTNYDASDPEKMGSILLFYQYKEPVWSETEFQKVLKKFLALGHKHSITGRGRIATEGVNCTLTGPSPSIRAFCQALREELDPVLFAETDFKITDFIPKSQFFKSLSMRKTDELVAYGLAHDKVPSIKEFGGTHLTAVDYHKALQDPNTVVIDVRNQYETAIGTIQPPPGGAKLIDPKLRNSHEWPKWLAAKETQQQLNGKKVMMFCTGGIRCERAAALVNQMAVVSASSKTTTDTADPNSSKVKSSSTNEEESQQPFQPQGVYHMQGGIERYLRTFPKGGFWTGKNYLFDKRMEQRPESKELSKVEQEVVDKLNAKCCHCRNPWTSYRGKFKCSETLCGVPVIVCDTCQFELSNNPSMVNTLQCELCREGYRAPQNVPDLVALRLKAEKLLQQKQKQQTASNSSTDDVPGDGNPSKVMRRLPRTSRSDRLFLSRLPLNVSRTQIQEWLQTPILHIQWLTDKDSGAFYGSCIVQIDPKMASAIVNDESKDGRRKDGKSKNSLRMFPGTLTRRSSERKRKRQQPKVSKALTDGQPWPPVHETEFPPLGHIQ
ncbi:rhodanese-like domain containing protein [Nitzschia inconspicua]|uniref:Rhodanese-like domain containing protein n=1 Tax=Nitzschia inconspicua TaxID=303405 RepID=A0A9K3Q422_9STRA|nr:rhodanese-like domain containing protein [Nitzschia inconspicua]